MAGFYMNCNTELKWVNLFYANISGISMFFPVFGSKKHFYATG